MKTRETTYVDLRKNPPKINKGNISGGPKDVAAVMVGAIVDMMYPEKYLWLSAIVDTLLARWFYGVIVRSVDDSIIHGSCIGWIVWLMVVRSKFSWFVGVTLLLSSLNHSFGSWIVLPTNSLAHSINLSIGRRYYTFVLSFKFVRSDSFVGSVRWTTSFATLLDWTIRKHESLLTWSRYTTLTKGDRHICYQNHNCVTDYEI